MPKSPIETPLPRIHTVRKQKVVVDAELARLYGVSTARLNEAVKRNSARFPEDFRFQLNREEAAHLKSQSAISSEGSTHGGRRTRPWVFTEHGALMAATVLNSPLAVQLSLYLIRAFVQMRESLLTNTAILQRLAEIDRRLLEHDTVLQEVVARLQPLLDAPEPEDESPRRKIGYHPGNR